MFRDDKMHVQVNMGVRNLVARALYYIKGIRMRGSMKVLLKNLNVSVGMTVITGLSYLWTFILNFIQKNKIFHQECQNLFLVPDDRTFVEDGKIQNQRDLSRTNRIHRILRTESG